MNKILKRYFGYDEFKKGQENLIEAILNKKDVLGIMPTGAGKSICFQVPSIMQEGITIVISPLISLMKDQVNALTQAGVSSAFINSSLTSNQINKVLQNAYNNQYKLIYVAPERLFTQDFINFAQVSNIAMITVDEAHCISQWGQDFRPSYARIPEFINKLNERPVISAFSATATQKVQEDIINLLQLKNPNVLVTGFNRENLYFEVVHPQDKMLTLIEYLRKKPNKSGIIYCNTRNNVDTICEKLNEIGFKASSYHAGLSDKKRQQNQEDFQFDKVTIMVATNAFGMGIDKSNVSFVIHFNMPKDIESYYQEAGRAGRDGTNATCLLMYSKKDVFNNKWMIENNQDSAKIDENNRELNKNLEYKRLDQMTFYSNTNDCLRGFILKYFGETVPTYCGNCSNCNSNFEVVDVTQESLKILSCIHRMKEAFGINMVIDVLCGSKNARIIQLGFNLLSTYNISEKSSNTLRAIIDNLILLHYIDKSEGKYPILKLTEKSKEILFENKKIEMKLIKEKSVAIKNNSEFVLSNKLEVLYERLKQIRFKISIEKGISSFIIFNDKALLEMCEKLPKNKEEFINISGVGEKRLEQYGDAFINEINDYCNNKIKEIHYNNMPEIEILHQIELFDSPTQISLISKNINIILSDNNCVLVTPQKIVKWLVFKEYLLVEDNNKIISEKGSELGIIQEHRSNKIGDYMINLYPLNVQKEIVSSIVEIFNLNDKK